MSITISELQKQIEELERDKQDAINAALVGAQNACLKVGLDGEGMAGEIWADRCARAIGELINTNPLADLQARLEIVSARAEQAGARAADAYSAGYEQAHDDTVEGNYSPELRLEDYLAQEKT